MSTSRRDRPAPPSPAFAGLAIDRVSTLRHDPAWVVQQLEDPTSRVVASRGDCVLVADAGEPSLLRRPVDEDPVQSAPTGPILLGLQDGAAVFALDLEALHPDARARWLEGGELLSLREAGSRLPYEEGALAAYLVGLLNWHRRNRFCANCGTGTAVAEAGYSRRCPNCGAAHFPRIDPVVIMLVEHDGSLLLGRRSGWPEGRYSVLAGYVSPGETLEEAVIREVREESGIEAYDPRFVTSQPWPFPSSLMLGFAARSDGGEPTTLDGELEDVRWCSRQAITAARAGGGGDLQLPAPVSIARVLIERWATGAQ